MDFLGDFLARYHKLIDDSTVITTTVAESITTILGVPIKPADVSYKEGVITIKATPALKLEIKLRQNTLIKEMNDKLPSVVIRKIT